MSWTAPAYRAYEHRLVKALPADQMPAHIGVILDGHRRFARAEGLEDYTASYRSGMAKLENSSAGVNSFRFLPSQPGSCRRTTCGAQRWSWNRTSRSS